MMNIKKMLKNFICDKKDPYSVRILGIKFKRRTKYIEKRLEYAIRYLELMNRSVNTLFRYHTGLQLNEGVNEVGTTMERIIVFDPKDAPKDHYKRYEFASAYCKFGTTLDIACGCGYGSKILSSTARTVLGVDINPHVINFANKIFSSDRLQYICQDASELNLDATFDCAVSFETIEHIEEPEKLLTALYRLLNKDGLLICSVPNQKIVPFDKNINIHHVRHYTTDELIELINSCGFKIKKIFYQYEEGNISELQEKEGGDIIVVAEKEN